MHTGVLYALCAALLFGAGTPFAKVLLGQLAPQSLAGLLYLGSGLGLALLYGLRALRRQGRSDQSEALARRDLPWLAGAIASGGILGPVLLMLGLAQTPAASAALLLNLEGVLTALLAWFVFRENFDRRIVLGMLLIVAAGMLLSWSQRPAMGPPWGALAIAAACLCWAIDNNLTRKVAAGDALQIAAIKGLVAGVVNLLIAHWMGLPVPSAAPFALAGVLGFFSYGLSLVLFVLALRHLGSARTGAYFSVAPFAGAALALLFPGEAPTLMFWIAAALMAVGIWLHVSEVHGHLHTHQPTAHRHVHRHDEHHRHTHDFDWDGREPHSHPHEHEAQSHSHAHFPDIHHRHRH
jgi:drug/metabolite transporter (DMT)-like permease